MPKRACGALTKRSSFRRSRSTRRWRARSKASRSRRPARLRRIALLKDAVAWLAHIPYTCAFVSACLAESHLRAGERGLARAVAETLLDTNRKLGYLHLEGWTERLLGECASADDPTAAALHLERAAEILEQVGAQNELAKTLVAQAELRAADGDPATTRQLLDRALAIFDALGTLDGPDRARRLLVTLEAG